MDRYLEFDSAVMDAFAEVGLAPRSRMLDLRRPPMRVRILEAGEGEPLILVHGGGGTAVNWAPLMARLPGRRLIAVDRPGCGRSDPADPRGRLRALGSEFVESLLDALEIERGDIVANSMGALWATCFALDHPERVGHLAMLGSPAVFPGTSAPPPMRLLSIPGLNRLLLSSRPPSEATMRAALRLMGEPSDVLDRLSTRLLGAFAAGQRLPDFAQGWTTLLEATLSVFGARNPVTEAELGRLAVPVLYVWGDGDGFGGEPAARRCRDATPSSRLVLVRHAGHLPWLAEPDLCAEAVLAFLAERVSAPVTPWS